MDKNVYEEGTLKYYSFFKDSKEMEEEQYGNECKANAHNNRQA